MSTIPLDERPVQNLDRRVSALAVVEATDPASFTLAGQNLRALADMRRDIEAEEKKATKPLNDALSTVRGWFRPLRNKITAAEVDQRRTMGRYQEEQERRAREAQLKAEAQARAERERLEAEARAAEEAARREAEEKRREAEAAEAEGRHKEAAKLAAKAEAVEAKGVARADVLHGRAETVAAAPPARTVQAPKAEGVAPREVWRFEVTNPAKVAPAFLCPDEKKIGATVRAMKADAASILGEGVRVWKDTTYAARRL